MITYNNTRKFSNLSLCILILLNFILFSDIYITITINIIHTCNVLNRLYEHGG